MLDNLFNSIVVLSFLAFSAFGALHEPANRFESSSLTVTQLERVIVIGQSLKSARPS